jgi:lysophospholipase L1-like esterase
VPFVPRLAQQLAVDTGQPVTAINDAAGGEDSGDLLAALTRPTRTARDVSTANIVTITIGANDVSYASHASGTCGGSDGTACYRSEMQAMISNVSAILSRIRVLRGGRPTTVLVTGYWNVWQDGQVANGMGAEFVEVSHTVTSMVNQGLQQAATSHGALYVDLAKAFTAAGPDDTGLLAADGDHPNAAGHQLIADVLTQAVLAGT